MMARTAAARAFLGAMIRVHDLERSIRFYRDIIGMTLTARRDFPQDEVTAAYLAFTGQPITLELEHSWGHEPRYDIADGLGHLTFAAQGLEDLCARISANGYPVLDPPRLAAKDGLLVAHIEDPDGYRVRLIESMPGNERDDMR